VAVAAEASLVAVAKVEVEIPVVEYVLVVLVTTVDSLVLLELDPPIAPYALLRSSLLRAAGSRFAFEHMPVLHGFALQQPRKVLPAVHVQNCAIVSFTTELAPGCSYADTASARSIGKLRVVRSVEARGIQIALRASDLARVPRAATDKEPDVCRSVASSTITQLL
jgi:hypothetical protein